jgi:peptide-methionine (S)-S-oxide reductase
VLGLFSGSGQGALDRRASQARTHAVLGTPIDAPAGSGQGEVLFGCGCFWGAEKGFWRLPGVVTTAVGYAGGALTQPTYQQVCSGRSGHAEVVRVVWDQEKLHLSDLLKLFWECHDPTQGDRQGNDRGSQYRSAIFINDPQGLALATASGVQYGIQLAAAGFGPITTEIRADVPFQPGETYHQQYLAKPGSRPYCSAQPTGILLADFPGCDYRLPSAVWNYFDWSVSHCVLRGDNAPIILS